MTRTEAFELAERKAKHSDYDWPECWFDSSERGSGI